MFLPCLCAAWQPLDELCVVSYQVGSSAKKGQNAHGNNELVSHQQSP